MLGGVISVFKSVCRSVYDPLNALVSLSGSTPVQVCQVSAQQPVQTELLMRYHQLQSRLATLKIENEEVRSAQVSRLASSQHYWAFCPLHRGFPAVLRCGVLPAAALGAPIDRSQHKSQPSAWELPVGQLFWIEMGRFPGLLQNCAVF